MAYRVLIVDDEAPARTKLRRLLGGDARFELAGEAADGAEAVAQVERLRPDLLILDIQMPGLTGFDVIEALGADRCPKVVFSTAFDRYAIAAFEAAAIDYLLKPYAAARFRQALDRAHAQLAGGRGDAEGLRGLVAGRPLERLLVRSGDAWLPLRLDRVTRLRAEDKYVRVYGEAGEHLVRQSLTVLASRVDPVRFVRVHRSEIVALDAVVRMEPWTHGDALLVLADGNSVVLSRNYREQFLERWGA